MTVVSLNITLLNADGTTNSTVDLDDGSATYLLAYTPLTPTETQAAFDPGPLGDGGELLGLGYRNVTEPLKVLVKGASIAAVRATIRSIETALQTARRYTAKKVFPRAYVQFVPEGTASPANGVLLRSELQSGQLTFGPTSLDLWNSAYCEVMISWTRRFYWEAVADVQLGLTNLHGTNVTTALQVDNTNDSTRDNYVQVASTVLGTIPAPVRLELTHSTNDAAHLNTIYVGVGGYGDGTVYTELALEGEAGSALGSSSVILPVTPNTSLYSGTGQYNQTAYALDSTEHPLFEWTLSQTLLNATRGQFYRLMVRFANYPNGNEQVRFRLYYAGLTVLWEGPLVALQSGVMLADLGAVQLPPWLVGANNQTPITLRMFATTFSGTGTQSVAIDAIHLLPTAFGWRRYTARGYGLPYNIRLVDDGINGYIYQDGWSAPGGRTGYYGALGSPLMVDPNAVQQFYFAWDTQTGNSEVTRTATVKLFYRPRYLTV